jgi:heat shock protein HspQ
MRNLKAYRLVITSYLDIPDFSFCQNPNMELITFNFAVFAIDPVYARTKNW